MVGIGKKWTEGTGKEGKEGTGKSRKERSKSWTLYETEEEAKIGQRAEGLL